MAKEYRVVIETNCSLCGDISGRNNDAGRHEYSPEELDKAKTFRIEKEQWKTITRQGDHTDLKDCIRYLRSQVDEHNSAIGNLEHPDRWD